MLILNSLLLFVALAYVPFFLGAFRAAGIRRVRREPQRKIRVTQADISLCSDKITRTVPWNRFRAVWEYPEFFILSFSRYLWWWLPRRGMPPEAEAIVHEITLERERR